MQETQKQELRPPLRNPNCVVHRSVNVNFDTFSAVLAETRAPNSGAPLEVRGLAILVVALLYCPIAQGNSMPLP